VKQTPEYLESPRPAAGQRPPDSGSAFLAEAGYLREEAPCATGPLPTVLSACERPCLGMPRGAGPRAALEKALA